MDLEQAKLILGSFRPCGSDANDPAFTEALELAARNPELGIWLAKERAQDLAFTNALGGVEIPENLREEIFELLANNISSPGYDESDQGFSAALASIQPPAGLRDDILAAMNVESKITRLPEKKANRRWFGLPAMPAIGLAAAAGIALAVVLTNISNPNIAIDGPVTASAVQTGAINFLSGNMTLDRQDPRQEHLYQFLASNELPTPEILPVGLREARGVGCKKLNFDDRPASLICYQQDEDSPVVHLIVMRKDHVEGGIPEMVEATKNCNHCHRTGWSMASWTDEERAFFFLGKMDPKQLAAFF
ncbi:MAG: hypothetical protein AAGC74_05375 [Verrucomicrobiota bacterium]